MPWLAFSRAEALPSSSAITPPPANTPREIVTKLSQSIASGLQSPETRERLASQGAEAVGNTPEQFARVIAAELSQWTRVVRESGAKFE